MANVHLNALTVTLLTPMLHNTAMPAPEAGGLQNRFGRRQVIGSGSTSPCLSECARDIYTVDEFGEPFPSGTVWVKTRQGYSGEGTLDQYWIPVPEVLPAGYTATRFRNFLPATWCGAGTPVTGLSTILWGSVGAQPVEAVPTYSPATKCIRTADGLYDPQGFDPRSDGRRFPWGPHVRYNKGFSYTETPMNDGSNRGSYTPAHPGYRACRVSITCPQASFDAATYMTGVTVGIDGSTVTVARASFSLSGGTYTYDVPTVFTPSLAAAGHYVQYLVTIIANGCDATHLKPAISATFKCSPRVDIPLPWFSSTYDVCAPGGLLTGGNVPGY